MRTWCMTIAILFCTVPSGIAAQPRASDTLVITHVTVLPMDRDTALLDHAVLIAGDRIVWIGRSADVRLPRASRTIDGRGAFLMPGLADMHVHVRNTADLSAYLAAGVTTVRNMHGGPQHLRWRDEIARGALPGPTIFTSGPPLGQYRWQKDPRFVAVNTTADAEAVVRQQADAGYDMIKVIQRMDLPVLQRVVIAARERGLPVVGHLLPGIGLKPSLAAGQVSIEHAYNLRERSRLTAWFGDERAGLVEDAQAVARAGAWVGTTASSRDGRCMPRQPMMRQAIETLHRAGVALLAGTDAGIGAIPPGASLHCELQTLTRAGLTPYEALVTATRNAGAFAKAHLRGAPPFGTITVGSRADLLLLPDDPRVDLSALARHRGVVVRGTWLPK
jgi:imidazolonepropionase-like amidohydrolase